MRNTDTFREARPMAETLEGRMLLSASPSLAPRDVIRTLPTHTALTVEAGTLGQPIAFHATVFCNADLAGVIDFYFHGKLLQEVTSTPVPSPKPQFAAAIAATYTVPAGTAGAEMFGVGSHDMLAAYAGILYDLKGSSALTVFRVKRPQFVMQPSGVGIATLSAGSGPALQPGQTATVQYNAYLAASYHLFYSTESQTPDTQSFTVDASPEQVIPGLDAGVVGMQAGETRAIYIPYQLGYGTKGATHVPRRANLVYLVTLVSIA